MPTVFPENISSAISTIKSNLANSIQHNDEQNTDIESDNVLFKSLLSFYARNGSCLQLLGKAPKLGICQSTRHKSSLRAQKTYSTFDGFDTTMMSAEQ